MLATDTLTDDVSSRRTAPRPIAGLVLVACAAASIAVGIATTVAVLGGVQPRTTPIPPAFWPAVAAGAFATCVSLGLRTVRWIFLLRRTNVRVPLNDASIGYLSGFSLLFVPLLVGETVVRAAIHRARAGVPATVVVAVSIWERLLDVVALAFIAAASGAILAGPGIAVLPLTIVAVTAVRSFRIFALSTVVGLSNAVVRRVSPTSGHSGIDDLRSLASHPVWLSALGVSLAAWLLPAVALWAIVSSLTGGFDFVRAQFAYASSALAGGFMLAPGGIRVVGTSILTFLTATGVADSDAAVAVLATRIVTAGLAAVLGATFVWVHVRTRRRPNAAHFDQIAHAYDAQIPQAQRKALLARKTALMRDAVTRLGTGGKGLDVGCGQGWYVARMRQLGFDVHGIDASPGQVARARAHVERPDLVGEGSVLRIPAADTSYDFAYCINVLHHLTSVDEQRAAFSELLRVLRPGGLLFVHEINTRNLLFRFYMGYVFPSLNCIDEGTERWLLPQRLADYTPAPLVSTSYFTFMPEFVPGSVLRLFRPIEAFLEASPLRIYSAHYMAIVRKPHGSV
jgi:2-polyprenyl-3-methyl-5-hydroxy-6-metoxy-1,4-benzoquinol methylase